MLSMLHSCSQGQLASLKRAMLAMQRVKDYEWEGRRMQMSRVTNEDVLEARVELFLLETGRQELGNWIKATDVALGMEETEREQFEVCYRDAAHFLTACILVQRYE